MTYTLNREELGYYREYTVEDLIDRIIELEEEKRQLQEELDSNK